MFHHRGIEHSVQKQSLTEIQLLDPAVNQFSNEKKEAHSKTVAMLHRNTVKSNLNDASCARTNPNR
jgi:hypothetical protein